MDTSLLGLFALPMVFVRFYYSTIILTYSTQRIVSDIDFIT
ncbi:hypothetical protein Psal027_01659 [Piscirickettsia salmonis]|nr:putative membrane protein [Piscirickettsia salmonis LF-89 = ATCC VR-1361]QGN77428.1 hypothetical protein Psal001_01639 [Piscirickettsia salmonis]QGN81013.1 hypothetical protein Psal002_01659 [Piscirickettsia salmonis]QGN84711.1 hypothetical protein Psal003_01769 [Piscirickettsia salmonis]QGN88220.1 hypothetical protein Psal004_01764 [Piscirickettsia salmonis]